MVQQESNLYEAMFLVDTSIAADTEATKGMIQTIMDRAQAELVISRLWDERRLAYDITKHKRATYILCYFRANGSAIRGIERDVQLSEHLLRVLVLRADHISTEELEEMKESPDRRSAAPAGSSSAKAGAMASSQALEAKGAKRAASEQAPAEAAASDKAAVDDTASDKAAVDDTASDEAPGDDSSTSDGSGEDERAPEEEEVGEEKEVEKDSGE